MLLQDAWCNPTCVWRMRTAQHALGNLEELVHCSCAKRFAYAGASVTKMFGVSRVPEDGMISLTEHACNMQRFALLLTFYVVFTFNACTEKAWDYETVLNPTSSGA